MRWTGAMAVLAAIGSTACGARTGELTSGGAGGNGSSGEGSSSGASGSGGGGGPVDTGPTRFTSAQVQAALARCDLPHGPAVSVSTADEESANLLGAWLLCPVSADAGAMTMLRPGILLGSYGSFHTLAADGDGGLEAGTGVTSQGTWSASCSVSSDITSADPCPGAGDIVVSLHTVAGDTSTAGCFGGPISFETSPRRMFALDSPQEWCTIQGPADFGLWLVALP